MAPHPIDKARDGSIAVTLVVEGSDATHAVDAIEGEEAIDDLFVFRATFRTDDEALDPDALVDKDALLTIESAEERRLVHGLVTSAERVDDAARASITVVLRPRAWLLGQGRDCRIFQDLTAPQIVAQVLAARGVDQVRFALQRTYEPRDVCVQYRESDWDFVRRLLEEEGLFHWFEHEEGRHVLVVADTASVHADHDLGPLPLVGAGGGIATAEGIESFRLERSVRPGRVTVRTVDEDNPSRVDDQVASRGRADLEVYEGSCSPRSAPPEVRAQDRLEAITATRDVARGVAQSIRLAVAGRFQLRDHPRAALNRGWVVTSLAHRWDRAPGRSGGGWVSTFACIPDDVPWRPALRTAKPRMPGPQTAEVVGPEGVEIHADPDGRVLVRMRWDRGASAAACWVHVAQSTSGPGYGAMEIPRVGTSVLVGFLDGDPDRPIVIGRVYHKASPPPYALPANQTKTALRTRSSPGGAGYNELCFEDLAGQELVSLRAQRDLAIEVLHDAACRVGGDDAQTVVGAQSIAVGATRTVDVGGARTTDVGGDDRLTVGGDRKHGVDGDESIDVVGSRTVTVGGKVTELAQASRERAVAGNEAVVVKGDRQIEVGGAHQETIVGGSTEIVGKTKTVSVGGNLQQVVDGELSCSAGSVKAVVESGASIYATGTLKVESASAQQIGAPTITVSGDTVTVRAYTKLVLEAGGSTETDRARVEITPDGVYVTNGDARQRLTGDTIKMNC